MVFVAASSPGDLTGGERGGIFLVSFLWDPGQPPCQAMGVVWSLLPLPSPPLASEVIRGEASFLRQVGMLLCKAGWK